MHDDIKDNCYLNKNKFSDLEHEDCVFEIDEVDNNKTKDVLDDRNVTKRKKSNAYSKHNKAGNQQQQRKKADRKVVQILGDSIVKKQNVTTRKKKKLMMIIWL